MTLLAGRDATATDGDIRAVVVRSFRSEKWIQWGVAIIVALLVLAPLLPVLYQSVADKALYERHVGLTLQNFYHLVSDEAFLTALGNSLMFAILGTLIAQGVGGIIAVLVGRTDMPLRGVVAALIIWPLFLSQLVITTGWMIVYGPAGYVTTWVKILGLPIPWNLYTVPGMAVAAAVCQVPITFIYCLTAIRSSDPALEDSARAAGLRPFQIFRRITLPLLRPALTISAILNVVMLLEALSIPLILGRPANIDLLMSFIYTRGMSVSNPDYGLIAASAVLLMTIVIVLASAQILLLRRPQRFVTIGGKANRPRPFLLGRWRWAAFGVVGLYLVFLIALPLIGLITYAFASFLTPLVPIMDVLTLDNFRRIIDTHEYMNALTNSLIIATCGGASATVLITLLALVVHRSRFPLRRMLDIGALLPRAVPGMIAGIGIFYTTILIPPLGWLRETLALIMIAFTMRYIPLGYGVVAAATLKLDTQLDRSARVLGADWWLTMRRIVIPLLLPAMISAYGILFIYFFKDYGTAVFLSSPGSEVLGTTMLQMFLSGQTGPAAALATIQIAITAVFILVIRRVAGVSLHD
ncbi:MAG TPA: iron ABC transporter permease [Xanthobacteraceae bacterium]|jgi:iron(III) transport system permease protein|nr:iron ABC transporter permease [Xanthobacteraceae bacterium]